MTNFNLLPSLLVFYLRSTYFAAARDDDDAVLLDRDRAGGGARVEQVDSASPGVLGPETVGPRVGSRVVDSDLGERIRFSPTLLKCFLGNQSYLFTVHSPLQWRGICCPWLPR